MPQGNISTYEPLYDEGDDKESIRATNFDAETLKAGTEVTVWAKQVNQDQVLWHGHGRDERMRAEAFVGLDLVASGNGDGTADADIEGDVILAITNSDQNRVLASTTFDSIEQLRDSLAESRTDRIVEAAMAPYAKPGRHIEVRIDADDSSDGFEIDPSASSGQLYYTEVDS
jgi:hypothetical protein